MDDDFAQAAAAVERALTSGVWTPTAAERALGAAVAGRRPGDAGDGPVPIAVQRERVAAALAEVDRAGAVAPDSPMRVLLARLDATMAAASTDPADPAGWGPMVMAGSVIVAAVTGDIDY